MAGALMPTKGMAIGDEVVSVVDETSVEVAAVDEAVDVVLAEDVVLERPKVIPLQTNWLTNLKRQTK
jgi:hypothetical protein